MEEKTCQEKMEVKGVPAVRKSRSRRSVREASRSNGRKRRDDDPCGGRARRAIVIFWPNASAEGHTTKHSQFALSTDTDRNLRQPPPPPSSSSLSQIAQSHPIPHKSPRIRRFRSHCRHSRFLPPSRRRGRHSSESGLSASTLTPVVVAEACAWRRRAAADRRGGSATGTSTWGSGGTGAPSRACSPPPASSSAPGGLASHAHALLFLARPSLLYHLFFPLSCSCSRE
jgi:hypothetical protein